MTNDKAQMPNKGAMTNYKVQNPKKGVVLAFRHLDFSCHLDFDIWNLANGIATPRQVGARNDKKRCT